MPISVNTIDQVTQLKIAKRNFLPKRVTAHQRVVFIFEICDKSSNLIYCADFLTCREKATNVLVTYNELA